MDYRDIIQVSLNIPYTFYLLSYVIYISPSILELSQLADGGCAAKLPTPGKESAQMGKASNKGRRATPAWDSMGLQHRSSGA